MYKNGNQGISTLGGKLTLGIKWLLIINVAVYVIELVLKSTVDSIWLVRQLALIPMEFIGDFKVWQILTYAFLHDLNDPSHLLFNMLGLWIFGCQFEQRWGTKSFIQFYLFSAIGAGLAVVLVSLLDYQQWISPTLGASGSIYALLAAFGVIFPNKKVLFYFLIPVKGKHLVYILIGITLLYAMVNSPMSYSAHLGGMLTGYLLITGNWRIGKLIGKIQILFLRIKYNQKLKKYKVVQGGKNDDKDKPGPYLH